MYVFLMSIVKYEGQGHRLQIGNKNLHTRYNKYHVNTAIDAAIIFSNVMWKYIRVKNNITSQSVTKTDNKQNTNRTQGV